MRFAWTLVDLYDDLTGSAKGTAPLPVPVPSCMESFLAMQRSQKQICGLEWANLGEVYTYLRNGKHLDIPKEWRKFLPKEPPLESGC